MNVKQYCALGAIVVGVALFGFGVHAKNKVSHAKSGFDQVSGFFPKNEAGSEVKNMMQGKLSQYDIMIRVFLVGGVVIAVAGIFGVFYFRKHR